MKLIPERDFKNVKAFQNFCFMAGVNKVGKEHFLQTLEQRRKNGIITKQQKYRLKQKIEKLEKYYDQAD